MIVESADIACEASISVIMASDLVIIGVPPSDELMIRFSEAWACLPTHGAWVGGDDGGAYVWLQRSQPDESGVLFGEIYSLHEKYQGRFTTYSDKRIQRVILSDLEFADPAYGLEFREKSSGGVRFDLIPIDADTGYAQVSADGRGSPKAATVASPAGFERNGTPVFEDGEVFFVVVSSRDDRGFVATVYDRDGSIVERAGKYVSLGPANEFSPDSLVARHSPFKLLISRYGKIYRLELTFKGEPG